MKTAKSIIVVLFVLLTAQIASAYYSPSTGRWLSRDPIGEPGFQTSQMASVLQSQQLAPRRWINRDPIGNKGGLNLYSFINNNPLCRFDRLGLIAVDIGVEVYIEGGKISFGGQIFNAGTKVRHTVHADTDSETLTQDKYIGETIEYDQNGDVIARDRASDSGLDASIICTKIKSHGNCCKFCYVAVWGHAVNPLAKPPLGLPRGIVPGIDYDINAEIKVCSQSVEIHYTGDHDRFPSYKFSILGDTVHSYSHLTAGSSPIGLFPVAQIPFSGYINLMTQ